ncbi:MAG: type II toxin-antitoxin system HicB family antitoxin [Planctomycetota bacterium]
MPRHFPIIIEQDSDGVFIVSCPVIQSCRSYGDTLDEAMSNIAEAIEACLPDETAAALETTFIGIRDLEIGSAS